MQKILSNENTSIVYSGFSESETIEIQSESIFGASKMLGKIMSLETKRLLKNDIRFENKKKILAEGAKQLSIFKKITKNSLLTIDGINYAQRYLEAHEGYSEGVGISMPEIIYMQADITAGCESIFSCNQKLNQIRLIHTEENSADHNFRSKGKYTYKLVKMRLPDKVVTFFAYPGMFWGAAFGINETCRFVQAIDDLITRDNNYPNSGIWVGAVAAMFLDSGNLSHVSKMVDALKPWVKKFGCIGGYAIHMAEGGPNPSTKSVEIAGKVVKFVDPYVSDGQTIVAQANYPRDKSVKKYSESHPPQKQHWKIDEIHLHVEMFNRQKRLLRLAKETKWPINNPNKAIASGLKLLANPMSDLAAYTDSHGKLKYYQTGLPSEWTVAHLVGYIDSKTTQFYIGKLTPKPIPGMEYLLKVDESYPYVEKKLWELVEKKYKEFHKKNK
jgi:hypothetical protein